MSILTLEPLREEFTMILNECACNERYRNIGNIEVGRRLLKAAIEHLQLITEPVSYRQRSPEPKHLDEKGRCWRWRWSANEWELCLTRNIDHTHWMPYWALPAPDPKFSLVP